MSRLEQLEKELAELKEAIARKEAIELAMEEIAIQFIDPSKKESSFNFALEKLIELAPCERAAIMEIDSKNQKLLSMTHEKTKKGVRSVMKHAQNIPTGQNKWIEEQHKQKGYVAIADVSKLPPEAETEKKMFQKLKIRSILIGSFASHQEFRGNLHLESKKSIVEWPPEIIRMLIFITVLIEHSIERNEANQKLIAEKDRAEQSDRMKSAFMANLSHEVRTPLNGIMGFTKLLSANRFNETKKSHFAKRIEKSADHLLSIIDDLIDLSRIESGSIKMIPSPVNVRNTVIGTYDSFIHELPPNRDLRLKLDLARQDSDIFIKTDARRLRQILDNLVKNAIRYTPSGTITLGSRIKKRSVHFFVKDTGIGIDKQDLSLVFDRFWQVDHQKARNYGGSGLGLSISKDFALMLGGNITVSSKPGKGSEFVLELPKQILNESALSIEN